MVVTRLMAQRFGDIRKIYGFKNDTTRYEKSQTKPFMCICEGGYGQVLATMKDNENQYVLITHLDTHLKFDFKKDVSTLNPILTLEQVMKILEAQTWFDNKPITINDMETKLWIKIKNKNDEDFDIIRIHIQKYLSVQGLLKISQKPKTPAVETQPEVVTKRVKRDEKTHDEEKKQRLIASQERSQRREKMLLDIHSMVDEMRKEQLVISELKKLIETQPEDPNLLLEIKKLLQVC